MKVISISNRAKVEFIQFNSMLNLANLLHPNVLYHLKSGRILYHEKTLDNEEEKRSL